MKKLGSGSMKIMKLAHITVSQIWFGTVFCLLIYAILCTKNIEADFTEKIAVIPEIYRTVILPMGIFCIVQGLIYGIFTKFGFFKQAWLAIKWIGLFIVGICTGLGGTVQIFSVIEKVNSSGSPATPADMNMFFLFIGIQLLVLMIINIVSIWRPRKKPKTTTA